MRIVKLTFLAILLLTQVIFSEVRYVSKTGSSTLPYSSWETASDSIQKCINISSFGDTIYVGNGVYKEKVVMIPGLALIGAGMDSCIVDTRELATFQGFVSISIADSCLMSGFSILADYNADKAFALEVEGGRANCLITLNRINSAFIGVFIDNLDTSRHANIMIYKNVFVKVDVGIEAFNSDVIIKNNTIATDPESQGAIVAGIHMGAYFFNNTPVIDSNYIATRNTGIYKSFGAKPIISNNIIMLSGQGASGIRLGSADSAKVYNNLIYAVEAYEGIDNMDVHYLGLYNNYITGINKMFSGLQVGTPGNVVKNNVITNCIYGVERFLNQPDPIFQYNNAWNNDVNYRFFTPDTTNISVDPMAVNDDINQGDLDFHLQMYSRMIDAGDPGILDKDSTRSDIGLYGGPLGESYVYQDLAPRAPRGLSVSSDTCYVTIKWLKNTEADFDYYKLYRDTIRNFTANDSTTLISKQVEISYTHLINPFVTGYYYKLKAVDKQGNESKVSEEINIITDVNGEQVIVNDYTLFQNYPNPFNPATSIGYRLKQRSYVKVMIYTVAGELIQVLVNETQEAGYHEAEFNPKGGIASGVYIYQMIVKNENSIPVFTDIKKMMFLK